MVTYNVVSGSAAISRASGQSEEITGPTVVKLEAGDVITETSGLIHYGANDADSPVVIDLTALLANGAPLATSTAGSGTGRSVHLTADLDSKDRSLFTAGPDNSVVYG